MPNYMIIIIFFALIFCNVPIAVSLGSSALIMIISSGLPLSTIGNLVYAGLAKYTMIAIPFFILAGVIMEYAGISKRLIDFAKVFVGHMRGGMIIVSVICCCFFGAISGSGTACVAALGCILIPSMVEEGYDRSNSTALISTAGGIGLLIPPSINFVIYSSIAGVSLVSQFTSGIIPGLLMGAFLIAAGYWSIRGERGDKIKIAPKTTGKEKWSKFKEAFWALLSPVIILGGIYSGIFTPTEAAGISVVYSFFVGVFVYKDLKLKDIPKMVNNAVKSTSVVMFIIAFASIFSWYLNTSHLAADLAEMLLEISSGAEMALAMMVIILMIAGCFLDPTSIYYIFTPIMIPVCNSFGIDLIHFGIVICTAIVVGLVTPPVGNDLYVGARVGEAPVVDVIKKLVPYIVASTLCLLLLTYVPALSLVLIK